jgi:hypothetical protein
MIDWLISIEWLIVQIGCMGLLSKELTVLLSWVPSSYDTVVP